MWNLLTAKIQECMLSTSLSLKSDSYRFLPVFKGISLHKIVHSPNEHKFASPRSYPTDTMKGSCNKPTALSTKLGDGRREIEIVLLVSPKYK